MTVTDSSGAQSTASGPIDFKQYRSKDPRAGCPIPIQTQIAKQVSRIAGTVRAGSTVVQATVPCAQSIGCSGQVMASPVSGFAHASAKKRRRAKPPYYAFQGFSVQAGKKKVMKAKLTAKARKTLRKRGKLRAKVRVSLVGPTGRVVSRTRRVTFRAPRRHRH